LCLTEFTAIVIVHNTMGTNRLKCNRSLTGGPEENGEDMVDNLERGLSKTRRKATGEKEGAG
jgi:hypothetical protein